MPNPSYKKNNLSVTPTPLLIDIQHATVRHLNKILFNRLFFRVKTGEHWAILGDSGSGKTALLHTLRGQFNITNGFVKYPVLSSFKEKYGISDPLFNHRQITAFVSQQAQFKNKENQKRTFFYQQRFHAHFSEDAVTVENYLKDSAAQLKRKSKPVLFTLEWIIKHLQLETLLPKTLIQLSNGETRRLQIAYALLEQPLILIMDNPLIGLDHATRPILKAIFDKITSKGVTLIMATTHREIPDCITHIAKLEHQKIVYEGIRENFQETSITSAPSNWQPNQNLLDQIIALEPQQDHHFSGALKMEDIFVKSSGNVILKDIQWEVKKGEKWSLVGPNGAGKSTLLSLISGDHPQSYANKISLFDKKRGSGESIWDIKHRIGFVSPEMHQYFRGNNTVLLAVLSGLDDTMGFRNKTSTQKEIKLAKLWLQLLEIEHLADTTFKDLSTGKQRQVLLIRALIKNPPLLILDEPCQGLDHQQRAHFKQIINTIWNSKEKTLLYVSHYKEDIPSCVNHIIELENGRQK